MKRSWATVACAAGVLIVALTLIVPSTSGTGPELDEGAVVAYASRVLDGGVPHRDFLTFYGPANPFVVAGAFAIGGQNVTTERVVGLGYRIVALLAIFLLALRLGGLLGAVLSSILAAKMLSRELIWAYATHGAIACGLLGLALASLGAELEGRRQRVTLLAAGVAGGAGVLFRFELALAVVVGALPVLASVPRRGRAWYAAGLLGAAGLYLPHLVIVGPDRVERLVGDLIATRSGRSLPLPPWGEWIAVLLALAVVAAIAYVALGVYLWTRRSRDLAGPLLVGIGLFALALLPGVLFRPDASHIRPFAFISISLLPAFALLLISRWLRVGSGARLGLSVAVALVAVYPVVSELDQTVRGMRQVRTASRDFFTDERGAAARAVIARTAALARPGDSLFVGPQDLRRTNYGPTYMYFLLRQLRPASYYMEMNPGTANREGSGLADELRRADWLILTTAWDDWDEPNDSVKNGPTEPNEVVRDDFCLRFEDAPFRLYERCDR